MTERATIRRSPHNKEHPYSIISNNLINDMELPLAAKAALIYLLSRPSDWVTHPRHLAKTFGIGRDQIYSILKKLTELGYCKFVQEKDDKGRYNSGTYYFSEEREIKEKFPHTDFQDTDESDTENKDITNTDLKPSTESTNTLVESGDSPVKPRSSARLVPKIIFNWDKKKFEGIEQSDLDRWQEQFPKISIPEILGLAEATIGSQQARYGKRKQIEKTIIEFFKRQSERPSFQKPKNKQSAPEIKPINLGYGKYDYTPVNRAYAEKRCQEPEFQKYRMTVWGTIVGPQSHPTLEILLDQPPEEFKRKLENMILTLRQRT